MIINKREARAEYGEVGELGDYGVEPQENLPTNRNASPDSDRKQIVNKDVANAKVVDKKAQGNFT